VNDARTRCRGCGAGLPAPFLDLGATPLANSYLKAEDLSGPEPFYPLQVHVCERCFLVQLPVVQGPAAIFADYAYFSSYSTSWLQHAAEYASRMVDRLALDSRSLVVEVASNDGYLLQYFRDRRLAVLGVEPARNVAAAAIAVGIPTVMDFFGARLARELAATGRQADLLVANNVLAHVPELEDFVDGLRIALKPRGLLTVEVPHLLRLMAERQFDTIYHEHLSYFSLAVVSRIFLRHGLSVVDVDQLATHGGSLRIYARHRDDPTQPATARIAAVIAAEEEAGMMTRERYQAFAEQARETKRALLDFLIATKRRRQSIVGYGAPAKGNTLLNYCGVGTDFIDYTVDRSPHKQGLYLPGSRIPIHAPHRITETKPDYVLILPWNLKDEIVEQMAVVRKWRGRFVIPIPQAEVVG
jgi:SAM-dependent methyltransferase